LLPNFNKIVEREFLITGFQQLEDVFSIVPTNLCAWFNVLGLAANDLSTERRKSGDDSIRMMIRLSDLVKIRLKFLLMLVFDEVESNAACFIDESSKGNKVS
jgi:hypothetical protein